MREPALFTLKQMRNCIAKDRKERDEPQFFITALIPPGAVEIGEGCYRTPKRANP